MNYKDLSKYYDEQKAKLDAKLAEADKILIDIQARLDESESNRKQSADVLASINQNYQQVIKLISDTNTDLAQISTLRATALDPTTGIETIMSKIVAISEQAEKTSERITLLSQTASTNSTEIKNNLAYSKQSKETIASMEKNAKELLIRLEETYQLAINTGLAGSFDNRRKTIEDDFVRKWSIRFSRSLFVLGVIAAGVMFYTLDSKRYNGFSSTLIFRLTLLTPLVFYTGYTAVQYQKERLLLEKYAFKSVVASSLESYTHLLKEQFSDSKYTDEVVKFVLSTMGMIYHEPHEQVKKRTIGLNIKSSKLAELKAELKEEITQELSNK